MSLSLRIDDAKTGPWRASWNGGPYIDIKRPGSRLMALDVVNVWDYETNALREDCPYTSKTLRRELKAWIVECGEDTARNEQYL